MGISNTAIPKYYGRFRESVLKGETIVNETISMEMNRIDDLIRHPGIYYDDGLVEGWIDFCENELVLTDGSPMFLLDSFKLWGEQLFGWYYFVDRSVPVLDGHGGHRYVNKTVKKRLINQQYIITARGSAKTIYDEAVHAYGLVMDPETTHQIATAPTMRQAYETLAPLKTAIIKARGPLFSFLTTGSINNTTGSRANRPKLFSSKKGIENTITNSLLEVLPMSIDKLQGYKPKYSTIDEWLSGDTREDVVDALRQGASKNPDWLIVLTSSEGTVRNGIGDTIKLELMKILKGEYYNPYVSIWYYRLDDIKEVANPSMWIKANPNLGKTVQMDVYKQDVDRAEQSPSSRNEILAKRFGIPLEGFTYFFTFEETKPCGRRLDFWEMSCALGADLSQGDDFCAFTFLFPLKGGQFGVKARSYITQYTFDNLHRSLRDKYEEFIREGSLIVMEGTVLDLIEVYDDLQTHIADKAYDVRAFGYDPYNAQAFVSRYEAEFGTYGVRKVPQGARTESVPLGEIKKLSEKGDILFDESIMSFTMQHCIVQEDSNGNRKLIKKRREEKIDNVAAMMDAYVAFKDFGDMFE